MDRQQSITRQLSGCDILQVVIAIAELLNAAKNGETWPLDALENAIKSLAQRDDVTFIAANEHMDTASRSAILGLGDMIKHDYLLHDVAYTEKLIICSLSMSEALEPYLAQAANPNRARTIIAILETHYKVMNILYTSGALTVEELEKRFPPRQGCKQPEQERNQEPLQTNTSARKNKKAAEEFKRNAIMFALVVGILYAVSGVVAIVYKIITGRLDFINDMITIMFSVIFSFVPLGFAMLAGQSLKVAGVGITILGGLKILSLMKYLLNGNVKGIDYALIGIPALLFLLSGILCLAAKRKESRNSN